MKGLLLLAFINTPRPIDNTNATAVNARLPARFAHTTEESANATPAAITVLGPPNQSSVGISRRQPAAAPIRSKKYTRSTRAMFSEIARDMIAPATKNGIAVAA